ncbi:6-phosphogluconolactonase [Amylibacter marinus]|uniref:6-phosphogluconolactonase n=1 Tax=Amylibacter marinus TaxID=1475483 RepID=A0ABQ5VST6_9RHOB|nr:6-phosphogluconolactonase [Amylibacter marinus]GLQ34426.1 6-phosphogluconolactonase [Amylibacter marinus]
MLNKFEDRAALMVGLAAQVAKDLRAALVQKERVSIAVPGGTTPAPFFDILCHEDLAWERVDVMLTDERFVPPTHARSNTALINARLITNAASSARVVPFYQAAERPEDVFTEISAGIDAALPLDICVLGMGADMHTASLFPDSAELADALASDAPVHVVRPASQPEARLTLTGRVLSAAVHKYVLIAGPEKLQALEQAQKVRDVMVAPIRVVLADPKTQVFFAP